MLQAVQHCETPSEALPPSDKPCAAHPLNIDYSDLCGPFPIMTPHGKHHFVISLDDQSNHLNLQLLAHEGSSSGSLVYHQKSPGKPFGVKGQSVPV